MGHYHLARLRPPNSGVCHVGVGDDEAGRGEVDSLGRRTGLEVGLVLLRNVLGGGIAHQVWDVRKIRRRLLLEIGRMRPDNLCQRYKTMFYAIYECLQEPRVLVRLG